MAEKEVAKAPEEKPEEDPTLEFVEVLGERMDGEIQARQKKHQGKRKRGQTAQASPSVSSSKKK